MNLTEATWERLQAYGSGFRSDPMGTPEKVIVALLDEIEETRTPARDRKPHVHVDQERYIEVLACVKPGTTVSLPEFVDLLDVSATTARRKLDGLVAQGRVTVSTGGYSVPA